jgi:hypothetical protein
MPNEALNIIFSPMQVIYIEDAWNAPVAKMNRPFPCCTSLESSRTPTLTSNIDLFGSGYEIREAILKRLAMLIRRMLCKSIWQN